MVVIGVTGGVGTGKSTVARMFARFGAVVLDADAIAHALMAPHGPAWRAIVKAFGPTILRPNRAVDRRGLAERVFGDPGARRRLERIVHPLVLREMARQLRRLTWRTPRVPAVVLDVPLLFEAGAQRLVDATVVVTAPRRVQQSRLRRERGWSDAEIRARCGAQWGLSAKVALADDVVRNGNGMAATRTQVARIWQKQVARNSK